MNKLITSSILATIFVFCFVKITSGVPAYPDRIDYTQPDGEVIQIFLKGDERINWGETPDGYTILNTSDGEFQYAQLNEKGDMVASGVKVSDNEATRKSREELLSGLPRGLRYSESQKKDMMRIWESYDKSPQKNFPAFGDQSLLLILIGTPDIPFTRTAEEFEALLNQINYTLDGASGSVKDYYLENSYGQFNLTVDVAGPYMAQNNMATYGSDWEGARQLATEAALLADADVDFSLYAQSGEGWVSSFYMIFSGHGEEAGAGVDAIWSHAWGIEPQFLDGVWVSGYACSPELRGNSGTNLTRIGVIGHEFGHSLGAPDYYDTGGNGYSGTGQWDMMAGGTWNNGGATPAHHNGFTKTQVYGWANATLLDSDTSVTMPKSKDDNQAFYIINTHTPGEYYLLENRAKSGFDQYIPGRGLIIYRVHSGVWDVGNGINAGHPQRMYPISAGSNTNPYGPVDSYGDISSASTPFPGSTQRTVFSDFTIPGSIAWSGIPINKPLSNISYSISDGLVSFDFMKPDYMRDYLFYDEGNFANSVGLGFEGTFQAAIKYTPEELEPWVGNEITHMLVYINDPADSASLMIWQGNDMASLINYVKQPFDQMPYRWNYIELDQPWVINSQQELWIGVEFDVPGLEAFPAGIDGEANFDGKGNLLRVNISNPEAWIPLTNVNRNGDWNIRALLNGLEQSPAFFPVSLSAFPADAGTVTGGGDFPEGYNVTVRAQPNEGFIFSNWSDDIDQVVSENPEYVFPVLASHDLVANFASTTSIANPDNTNLFLYPNPATNHFSFRGLERSKIQQIEVSDLSGRVYFIANNMDASNLHDITGLAQGVYIVRVLTKEGLLFARKLFVIEE